MVTKGDIERMEQERDVNALIEVLGHRDSHVQERARHALCRIGFCAVKPLKASLLRNRNPTIRWRSAEVLGDMKEAKAVPVLIRAFEDDESAVVWRAIEALVNIDAPALPHLREAFKSEDDNIRWCARKALKLITQNVEKERREYLIRALHGNELQVDHVDDAWFWQLREDGNRPQTCVPRIASG